MRKLISTAVVGILVALFLIYVWPTPYQYFTLHEPAVRPARVQRFTGRTEVLGVSGWVDLAERRRRAAAAAGQPPEAVVIDTAYDTAKIRVFDSLSRRQP